MGWWSAQYTGTGVLTFDKAMERARGKYKKDWRLAGNTELHVRSDSKVALEYHGKDIIIWHKDGRVEINTYGWSGNRSMCTRVNEFQSYVQLWHDGRQYHAPFMLDHNRFGTHGLWWDNEHKGWPWPGKMVITPGRPITGLQDRVMIVDPAKRKARKQRAAKVRDMVVPRLVLGEFDAVLFKRFDGGWSYQRPTGEADTMLQLFSTRAKHAAIHAFVEEHCEDACVTCFGRKQRWGKNSGVIVYDTRIKAVQALVNWLLRQTVLRPGDDMIQKFINYPPIKLETS